MQPLPASSPFDGGDIIVTRFYCPESDVSVDGRFQVHVPFAALSDEQLHFVEAFVRNEGKLSRLQEDLGLSYPTLRNRLHAVIRGLGYEPGQPESAEVSAEERRHVLEELERGVIDFDEAMRRLEGEPA